MKPLAFITSIILLCFTASCLNQIKPLKTRSEKAFDKAKKAMLSDKTIEIDVVWLLKKVLKSYPDKELEKLIEQREAAFFNHPMLIMITPHAPRIPLPTTPLRGLDQYYTYVQSPFGEPKELAIQYLNDYLAKPASGYILTHQLLVLIWAEETSLILSPELQNRKKDLWEKIYAEQSDDTGVFYIDLYAERAALLLEYGKVSLSDAEKWIELLILLQNKTGSWPTTHAVLQYDGQFGSSLPPPSHTTVLAMTALRNYIDKY